jgi:Flp pilus assembly protein protease CpaA
MAIFGWVISVVALVWLIVVAVFDIRTRQVPSPLWTGIPLIVAAAYRLAAGTQAIIVAAAAVVLLVSERRHLQQKLLEAFVVAAGILVLGFILLRFGIFNATGIVGIIVFWVAWELKLIGGADAMVLIACTLIWPGVEFVYAYLLAGLAWSVGVRIKEGGWLKGHDVPGLAVAAAAAALYLLYRVLVLAAG